MKLNMTATQQRVLEVLADIMYDMIPGITLHPGQFIKGVFQKAEELDINPGRSLASVPNMTRKDFKKDSTDTLRALGFEIRDNQVVRLVRKQLTPEVREAVLNGTKAAVNTIYELGNTDAGAFVYGVLAFVSGVNLHDSASHEEVIRWEENGYPESVVDLLSELGFTIEKDIIVKIKNVPA